MPVFYGAIDLAKNELRNAVIQNLGAAPSSPSKGQLYFDSIGNILYFWDGTTWQSTKSGTGGPPTGAAGGDLTGSYPNPTIGAGKVTSTAILDGTIVIADTATAFDLGALAAAHPTTTDVNYNGHKATNQADPTAAQDSATKNYVDTIAQGLDAKASVKAASTANLTQSGTQTVDGIALVAGDRVLCKDQTTTANNGIWLVASGAWTRATDMDAWAEVPSAFTWVEQGTVNADTGWVCTADQGGTLGTTAITWTQFSGAAQLTAGAGLTKTGNTIDVIAADSTMTVAADSIAVNTSVIATQAFVTAGMVGVPKKFAAALTGTASPEVVTHNLNTRDIQLTVLNGATPYTAVEVDWDATSVNTATIRYNPNLGAGYRVVIVG
jgi:hypothetical protein